ncbi:MAG: NHL repeat-containing protein [Lewinellaceae bacterium]|nr:NHL repeat-containing protein [Lewinellaceae bacterium]
MMKTTLKNLLLLVLVAGLASQLQAQQGPWDGLQQLTGLWKNQGKASFEKWEMAAPTAMLGEGYRQNADGEKQITEYLRIVRQPDGSIVYQATVLNQNDSATIDFPMTFFTTNSWTFENPKHDFPQKIEYWFQDDQILRVTVSGGDGNPFIIWFNRISEKQAQLPRTLKGYELFVSSRNTGTVKRFNAFTGAYLGEFGKEQIGNETQDVVIGPDGMLYVSSLQTRHILKFDPATGAFLENFTSGYELKKPTKISFAPDGYLYVSQWGEDQSSVVRFHAQSGVFDRDCTGPQAGPLGHSWDSDGNLYVACFFSKDVRKFSPDGTFLGVVISPDQLRGPSNLWFNPGGDLLVADWDSGSIKKFRNEPGGLVFDSEFASGFARLEGVAIGPDGYLYACDWYRNIIQKLNASTGSAIGVYLDGGAMERPNGLAFYKAGG